MPRGRNRKDESSIAGLQGGVDFPGGAMNVVERYRILEIDGAVPEDAFRLP